MKQEHKTRLQALEQSVTPHSGIVYTVKYRDGSEHHLDGHNALMAAIAGLAVRVTPPFSLAEAIIDNNSERKNNE